VRLIESHLDTNARGYVEEAQRIVRVAEDNGVTLRLIGGLAIRFHCHGPHSAHLREYHDIDVFGLLKESKGIFSVFQILGYRPNTKFNLSFGDTLRLQFLSEAPGNVDVFLDKFRMDHTIDFREHLGLDDLTIPITALLLTKLQMVRIGDKDVRDIVAILEDHEFGSLAISDREAVDVEYLADKCSQDWGLYKTVTDNLQKMAKTTESKELGKKLDTLLNSVLAKKKGFGWTVRSVIGERMKWYDVIEVGEGEAY